MFRLVPRNRFYGFRVPPAMRNDAVWYHVNASAGRHGVALGLLLVALDFTLPTDARRMTLQFIALAGLALIVAVNWHNATRFNQGER